MSPQERDSSKLDIYTMPLTHVSLEHDTAGLYDRLQRALGKIGLEQDELIQNTLRLGMTLHQNDGRTYEPYNNHLLRVTLRLIEELKVTDRLTIAAAPLHDSLEDHPDALAKMYLDLSAPDDKYLSRALGYYGLRRFGLSYDTPELSDIVLAVSNPLLEPGDDKNASYTRHIRNLMENGPLRPRILKIADILDNVDVPEGLEDPHKRDNLDKKQEPIYPIVLNGLAQTDNHVTKEAQEEVRARLAKKHNDARRRMEMRRHHSI